MPPEPVSVTAAPLGCDLVPPRVPWLARVKSPPPPASTAVLEPAPVMSPPAWLSSAMVVGELNSTPNPPPPAVMVPELDIANSPPADVPLTPF